MRRVKLCKQVVFKTKHFVEIYLKFKGSPKDVIEEYHNIFEPGNMAGPNNKKDLDDSQQPFDAPERVCEADEEVKEVSKLFC